MPGSYLVVTRHAALVEYLLEEGLVPDGVPVLSHADAEDVRGRRVIGVLPLHLAALADSVTEVPLRIPEGMRGRELSLEEVRAYADAPVTYRVQRL